MTLTRRDLLKAAAVAAVPGSALLGSESLGEPLGNPEENPEEETQEAPPRSGGAPTSIKLILTGEKCGYRLECFEGAEVGVHVHHYSPHHPDCCWMFEFLLPDGFHTNTYHAWPNIEISRFWEIQGSSLVCGTDDVPYQIPDCLIRNGRVNLDRFGGWGYRWWLQYPEVVFPFDQGYAHLTCESTEGWLDLMCQSETTRLIHPRLLYTKQDRDMREQSLLALKQYAGLLK